MFKEKECQQKEVVSYEGHQINLFKFDGNWWWLSRDVCRVLGFNIRVVRMLVPSENIRRMLGLPGLGGACQLLNHDGVLDLATKTGGHPPFVGWVKNTIDLLARNDLPCRPADTCERAAHNMVDLAQEAQEMLAAYGLDSESAMLLAVAAAMPNLLKQGGFDEVGHPE